MPTPSLYHWTRIAAPGTHFAALEQQIRERTLPTLEEDGGRKWMLANGLFGLWNHEVVLVTTWPAEADPRAVIDGNLPAGASVVDRYDFVATARPANDEPPARPGIYVHRLFGVDAANVDRFVALSEEAWKTFEAASDYGAQPQGLFRQREHPAEGGLMLLVTWYDRLESWERSRTPHPDATANFRERARITTRSIAFPTRLAGSIDVAPGMGSR